MDSFQSAIQTILNDKPSLPTILLLEQLRTQGYTGSRTILYDYVRQQRLGQQPAYIPLEMLPGEQAQVDWGYCDTISCGQHRRKLYVFCMTFHWEYIKNIVLETHGSNFKAPISPQNHQEIMQLEIEPPDLAKYDQPQESHDEQ